MPCVLLKYGELILKGHNRGLCRYSQDHNLKLRHVAEHLVTTRELPTVRL